MLFHLLPHRLLRIASWNSLRFLVLLFLSAMLSVLLTISWGQAIDLKTIPPSQYSSTVAAPFNQPGYYAITDAPPANYRPISTWVGRLILPTVEEYQQVGQATQETDWAWFEVETAPPESQDLVGKTVRLAWLQAPQTQLYVQKASRDVRLAPEVEKSWGYGIIHPVRLDGRNQVGPLQSMAGGHVYDDVTVILEGELQVEAGTPSPQTQTPIVLRVSREPLQTTGRFVGLVKFLEPVVPTDPQVLPAQCPGEKPCAPEFMRVQHYNPATRQFDGAIETIRIPQQPEDKDGIYNMTTRDLVLSPAGTAGWYIFGASDDAGVFTVQAMQPRSLVQLQPQQTILGFGNGLKYINYDNWANVEDRKGTLQTVLVDATAPTPEQAMGEWQEGDRFLLIHNYGGRGGTHAKHESYVLGNYPGHFSFGTAKVVRDPFTEELIFDVDYYQVYGNGGDGTLSGGQTWANYMGNLRRGVMTNRPISDVLINFDSLTQDYDFGGTKLSFFNELIGELSLIGARYRIGDGSGDSTITSATSCVQDSAQALFMTLVRFREKVEANPQIIAWMKANPTNPSTVRFRKLAQIAQDMADQLTPMGVVRWDWKQNAEVLTGVRSDQPFISIDNFKLGNLLTGFLSWRTALPRQAHDEFSMLFLQHGGSLWFLRTNQIGGNDPTIAPLEPTLALGAWKLPGTQIPLLSFLVIRTFGGVSIPDMQAWFLTLVMLLSYMAITYLVYKNDPIATAIDARAFLTWQPTPLPWYRELLILLRLLFIPALVQEYIFRVLLIPYPKPWIPEASWWAWATLALGLFVTFQVVYGKWIRPKFSATLTHPTFLVLITLLGIASTILYRFTASLGTITVLHWFVVAMWWLLLGGRSHFAQKALRV